VEDEEVENGPEGTANAERGDQQCRPNCMFGQGRSSSASAGTERRLLSSLWTMQLISASEFGSRRKEEITLGTGIA
jgi:hypothetical protein